MAICEILKRVIARVGYDAADLQPKMDVYLLYNRLTPEQYDELMASMIVEEQEPRGSFYLGKGEIP